MYMIALFSAVILIWGLPIVIFMIGASLAALSPRCRSALERELLGDHASNISKKNTR
jgi:cytochrome c-type biogenesis protein CcmH/NrfF